MPRKKLDVRIRQFQEGEWLDLLNESTACATRGHLSSVRARRRNVSDEARGLHVPCQWCTLAAARQALEGGRFSKETNGFLTGLAKARARSEPPLMQRRGMVSKGGEGGGGSEGSKARRDVQSMRMKELLSVCTLFCAFERWAHAELNCAHNKRHLLARMRISQQAS